MRMHKKASQAVQQEANHRAQVQKNIIAIVALISVMMIFWLSAVPLLNWFERAGQSEELRNAQAAWNAGNLANYEFEFDIACLCDASTSGPVTVSVREAAFDRAYFRETGEPVDITVTTVIPRTMAGVFAIVSDLIEAHPAKLEVSYDLEVGFPLVIRADFDKNNRGDEVGYYLSNFRTPGSND
jgi:hypothetical protein